MGETAAPVAPEMLKPVFRAPRPAGPGKASAGTVMLASGDPAVFVVTAVKSGSVTSSPDAMVRMPERAQAANNSAAAAEFGAYLRDIERTAKIKRNDDKVFVQ